MERINISEIQNGYLVAIGGDCACGKPVIFVYETKEGLIKAFPQILKASEELSEQISEYSCECTEECTEDCECDKECICNETCNHSEDKNKTNDKDKTN